MSKFDFFSEETYELIRTTRRIPCWRKWIGDRVWAVRLWLARKLAGCSHGCI